MSTQPRVPAGNSKGGEFASKSGADYSSIDAGTFDGYAHGLEMEAAVRGAIDTLHGAGIRVPAGVKISVDDWNSDTNLAAYRPDTKQIVINSRALGHWWGDTSKPAGVERFSEAQKTLFKEKIASSDHPSAPVIHEIGHALHHENVRGIEDWEYKGNQYTAPSFMTKNERLQTYHEVGHYASEGDPREFVAEVFAGLATGKKYGTSIMRAYKKYRGPKVTSGV